VSILKQLKFISGFVFLLFTAGCSVRHSQEQNIPSEIPQSRFGPEVTDRLMATLKSYYAVKDALAKTRFTQTRQAALAMQKCLTDLETSIGDTISGEKAIIDKNMLDIMKTNVQKVTFSTDEDCEYQRVYFKVISDALYRILKESGLRNVRIYRDYCPNAFNEEGAFWLSQYPQINNPYFGQRMYDCGQIVDSSEFFQP